MGNASGRNDVEGTSREGFEQVGLELASTYDRFANIEAEPMVQSPPLSPTPYLQHSPVFSPQAPAIPSPRPAGLIHVQNYALVHSAAESRDVLNEKMTAVMITWSYGGNQVAVTGSWDNWDKREPMHKWGKDFVIMKMLPSGVFHYRFIVDKHLKYAPDLPWECDESGIAYNILDVQEDVPEAPESSSEFEAPPSPVTSYNNESLDDTDFSKQPPDIPPQLQLTLLNDKSAIESRQMLPRPQHAVLNHLYIQKNRSQPVALGLTCRFLQKYVTVVLYKPSRR